MPNLFEFATSELSQDAFLCWLLSWADRKYATTDEALHETGVAFVRSMMKKCGKSASTQGFTVTVEKQYEKIDVFAIIKQGDRKYALVIEDKRGTGIHGNQLERYKKTVEKKFPNHKHCLVYLKTEAISSEEESVAKAAGYQVYSGEDLQELLGKRVREISSDIFIDFYKHLDGKNKPYRAWREEPVKKWAMKNEAWQGFYSALREKMTKEEIKWDYKSNRSGGEYVACWNVKELKDDSHVYLELHKKCGKERYYLAFRISRVPTGDAGTKRAKNAKKKAARDKVHDLLIRSAQKHGWGEKVKTPAKRAVGDSMTCCDTEGANDCWLEKHADGKLNMGKTIVNLRKADEILSSAVRDLVKK